MMPTIVHRQPAYIIQDEDGVGWEFEGNEAVEVIAATLSRTGATISEQVRRGDPITDVTDAYLLGLIHGARFGPD